MLNEHFICHGVRLDDRILGLDRKTSLLNETLIFIISSKSPFRMSCSDVKLSWENAFTKLLGMDDFISSTVYPIEFAHFNKLRMRIDRVDDM